jgi:hypothetical protein
MTIGGKQQFRVAMCAHKAAEVAGVCMLLMVEGNLAGLTLTHLGIASQTGLLAVAPVVGVTLTRYARLWPTDGPLQPCLQSARSLRTPRSMARTIRGKRIERLAEAFV